MANSSDVVNKIMRYKLQLTNTEEAAKILKTLKKLKDLEITLDVLAETGIGKAVNTLRRHELAGDLAKSLVRNWKKLVPKGSNSPTTDNIAKDELVSKDKSNSHVHATKDDLNNNCLTEKKGEEPVNKKIKKDHFYDYKDTDQLQKQHVCANDFLNKSKVTENEKNIFDQCYKESHTKNRTKIQNSEDILSKGKVPSHKRRKYNRFSDDESDHSDGDCGKKSLKETKSKSQSCPKSSHKKCKDEEQSAAKHSEAQNKKTNRHYGRKCKEKSKSSLSKNKNTKHKDKEGNSDREEPTMSFEHYLNYDENVSKRKERPKPKKQCPKSKLVLKRESAKVVNIEPEEEPVKPALPYPVSPSESTPESIVKLPETPPLESWFSEVVTCPQRKADKESDSCEILDESAIFTGQRLNKKMQVYSGAKTIFLPAMMSLYQQCIRTLQNNINMLFETGGVPFDILEPVLERCTPEQLLRIEEYNPIYIGETDHLWGKHCQRDFKDAKLQEYESWKEMYLRQSEERERKFEMLTKTIVSAQSSKPKGRQVKMAFIHSVAKPPRDVRIKQEIHGTAVQQPQPKCSVKVQDIRPRQASKEPSSRSSSVTTSATSNSLDPRKKTKVAPMMAKSLKAFKKHFGR